YQSLSQFHCKSCQMSGFYINQSCTNKHLCTICQASKLDKEQMEKYLPIWYDQKHNMHYLLPPELQCLWEGEKLLIQQVAAYVLLLYLKDGQMGSRGHVC